jgi:hypothetical protein
MYPATSIRSLIEAAPWAVRECCMNGDPHRLLINAYFAKHSAYLETYGEFRKFMIFSVLSLFATSIYLGIAYFLNKPQPDWMLMVYSFLGILSLVMGSAGVLVRKKWCDLQKLKAHVDKAGLAICSYRNDRSKLEILDADRVPDNFVVIPQFSKITFRQYKDYFQK